MFTVRRRNAARLAAAILASGLFAAGAIAGAGSAVADDATPTAGGATATLGGLKTYDGAVIHENGTSRDVSAGLFEMSVDGGGAIQTYCIDINHHTLKDATYKEVPWDASSLHANPNAGKINWILQHSYPQVNDLAALASTSGAGTLSQKTAAAGTQVAIWRFSDGVDVTASDPDAEKLADYLQQHAADTAEPDASLSLSPTAVSGKAGDKLGPVTVHTNADSVALGLTPGTPSGVKLVDKDGKEVTTAADGAQVYFDVPAGTDGTAALTATATTTVPVGRAFTATDSTSQTQILAGSSDSTVSATANGTWAKKGAIPAVSAAVDCAKGGVDVTATNEGDEDFTFQLAGKEYTVAPGKSETITVPVDEDQAYKISITGPNGFEKTFEGVLDCKTATSGGGTSTGSPTPSSSPSTATTGSTSTGGDLAETGSSSATPVIAGIAIVLVLVGGGAVFFLRKKKSATPAE
jgi:TQXA domain-containing protein/LPXTG-motif cell wall-anchored protein